MALELVHILEKWELTLRGQTIEKVRVQQDPTDDSSTTWEDASRL